jgi:superfamily II DNA or RNA helicase
MIDGLEWNVRLAQIEQAPLLDTFQATFDEYWNDPSFEAYDPERAEDRQRLKTALAAESGSTPTDLAIDITSIDVKPYGYQQEILEGLDAERSVHGRHRNLVVMATGTGKTVVAGLDYRRLREAGAVESILFVAHQERILRQSRSVFRHVLRDGTFGELFLDGERPEKWQHVFASIQSLHRMDLGALDPNRFDMVIVDEFHHSEAQTYTNLLKTLQPKILLGLTATPERSDGQDVMHWFGGHIAVELRLWEALERQLLAPFQYFGIHDDVSLSEIRWKRGQGYNHADLENLYTGNDARARLILQAVHDTADVATMKAIGFCVGVEHATFMAAQFNRAGIPARSLTAKVDPAERSTAIEQLKRGDLKVIFSVDLFNEGVDVPAVNTILLLRPTESATIFLQQLGRGLRLADNKPCLTVLDFIGAQNAQFRFDQRYRALTGSTRRGVIRDVEHDFPTLPAGCHIHLDRVAKQIVLDNVRTALKLPRKGLVSELRHAGDVTLPSFLTDTGIELEDLYRRKAWGGWSGLRREAGLDPSTGIDDTALSAAIGRMLHIDDPDRLTGLRKIIDGATPTGRLAAMLKNLLWGQSSTLEEGVAKLIANARRRDELRQIAGILGQRIHRVTKRVDPLGHVPLHVHARYSKDEACIAMGFPDPSSFREGVKWLPDEGVDFFFVTLRKTEQHYSPTTMYQDRAITADLFQWESQSTIATTSKTGQRYVNGGSSVHLFLREHKEPDGDLGVPPYLYAGPMTYVSHTGDRPMRIRWRLATPLPADMFHAARVAAG